MSIKELQNAVYVYLEELENEKVPPICSMWFREVSFSKAACKEILNEIELSEDLPFVTTASDILKCVKRKYDYSSLGYDERNISFSSSVGLSVVNKFLKEIEERKDWELC